MGERKMNIQNIRRKLVVARFTLSRAYVWVQTPGMILMMAAVLSPYVQQYIEIPMWQLFCFAFLGLLVIGFVDKKAGFLKTEISYNTENNSLLLQRLNEIEAKIDGLSSERENQQ